MGRLTALASGEVNGIEMGILPDGRGFLSERALARLCGVGRNAIVTQRDEWAAGKRTGRLAKKLVAEGYDQPTLSTTIHRADGTPIEMYLDVVCMTFVDYYAFDTASPTKEALSNFRLLARLGLRAFVQRALGYTEPSHQVPSAWRKFHDRLLLDTSPRGFFSVFKELSDVVLAAIRAGLDVGEHTVPDISVGKLWATHWAEAKLEAEYGPRQRHEHNYPQAYPQARSNPQEIWVYPVSALGAFRSWLEAHYLPKQLPKYLTGKIKQGLLPPSTAEILIAELGGDERHPLLAPMRET